MLLCPSDLSLVSQVVTSNIPTPCRFPLALDREQLFFRLSLVDAFSFRPSPAGDFFPTDISRPRELERIGAIYDGEICGFKLS